MHVNLWGRRGPQSIVLQLKDLGSQVNFGDLNFFKSQIARHVATVTQSTEMDRLSALEVREKALEEHTTPLL